MANSVLTQRAINLDDFRNEINIPAIKVWSIEWVNPDTVNHKCVIKLDSGVKIIDWTCHDVGRGDIKYFDSIAMNLVIENEAVDSGEIIIMVR
jgi:hypothetical protein